MNEQLKEKIEKLKEELTGNMFEDMDKREEIHSLEMKAKGVTPHKPEDSEFECFNCGS